VSILSFVHSHAATYRSYQHNLQLLNLHVSELGCTNLLLAFHREAGDADCPLLTENIRAIGIKMVMHPKV